MTTQTATLTEFLLARISEDEALAWADNGYSYSSPLSYRFEASRILAECEAKRRIVELHDLGNDPCDAHDASFGSIPCDTLLALALPHADHPDYQPEWRL